MSDRMFADCCYGSDQQHLPSQPCPQLTPHQKKMARKAAAHATMTAGFTPVRNSKVDAQLQVAALRAKLRNRLLTPAQAEQQGYRDVCNSLPRPAPFRHLFPRPSKNDSAAYRKAVVPSPARKAA